MIFTIGNKTIGTNIRAGLLIGVFHAAGMFVPAAKSKAYKLQAMDDFKHAKQMIACTADPMAVVLAKHFLDDTKTSLKAAGQDVNSDKPYVEILRLNGGKKEFDTLLPQ